MSNLNCATGWYRSIIESLFGIEFDTGGMTVIPLDLPLGPMKLRQLVHRGSMWDVSVENGGRSLDLIRIDGRPLHGCTKIPSRYHDNASHQLEVTYAAREPGPLFTEIVNAEVIESRGDHDRSTVTVRALGTVDVAFPTAVPVQLSLDGTVVPFSDDLHTHTGFAQLPIYGTHELSLSRVA